MAVLIGMKSITDYLKRHESTILTMVRQYPTFPIRKIGGIWESDTESIDAWKKRYFEGQEPEKTIQVREEKEISPPVKKNGKKKLRK